MSAPLRQRLSGRRLRAARDFMRLKEEGRRLAVGCLTLNWMPIPAGTTSRLGVVTSRRIGEAVVRSRARRLLREAFRRQQDRLKTPAEIVLVARNSIAGQGQATVDRDFMEALRRAGLLAGNVPATGPQPKA